MQEDFAFALGDQDGDRRSNSLERECCGPEGSANDGRCKVTGKEPSTDAGTHAGDGQTAPCCNACSGAISTVGTITCAICLCKFGLGIVLGLGFRCLGCDVFPYHPRGPLFVHSCASEHLPAPCTTSRITTLYAVSEAELLLHGVEGVSILLERERVFI